MKDFHPQLIKSAKSAGRQAAYQNNTRPTERVLLERHPEYTDEQIQAYYDAYDLKVAKIATKEESAETLIQKVAKAGYKAAWNKKSRPTVADLKKRHPEYSSEDIKVYLEAFDNKKANTTNKHKAKSANENVKRAGKVAASYNHVRASEEALIKRHPTYTSEEIAAYYKVYDDIVAKREDNRTVLDDELLIKKAKRAGQKSAYLNAANMISEQQSAAQKNEPNTDELKSKVADDNRSNGLIPITYENDHLYTFTSLENSGVLDVYESRSFDERFDTKNVHLMPAEVSSQGHEPLIEIPVFDLDYHIDDESKTTTDAVGIHTPIENEKIGFDDKVDFAALFSSEPVLRFSSEISMNENTNDPFHYLDEEEITLENWRYGIRFNQ